MRNINMTVKVDIPIDLTKEFGRSKSGKTIIVASTEGNLSVPGKASVKIGTNVYK